MNTAVFFEVIVGWLDDYKRLVVMEDLVQNRLIYIDTINFIFVRLLNKWSYLNLFMVDKKHNSILIDQIHKFYRM